MTAIRLHLAGRPKPSHIRLSDLLLAITIATISRYGRKYGCTAGCQGTRWSVLEAEGEGAFAGRRRL